MSLILIVCICALAVLLIRLLLKPLGWAVKLLVHAGIGFAALFLLNFFGSSVGIGVEMNWNNALTAGFFGLPGVVALVLMNYFS